MRAVLPPRFLPLAFSGLALTGYACADDRAPHLRDLEGPRGRVAAPGPWAVTVLTDGAPAEAFVAVEPAPFAALPLVEIIDGRFEGIVPDQPLGAMVLYYAQAGGETLPAAGSAQPHRFEVVAPTETLDAAPPAAGCALRFRRPLDGDRLAMADDAAPQAGLQLTVVVESNLPDGTVASLQVDEIGYAGRAGAGVVAFDAVTFPAGAPRLRVEGRAPGGLPCAAEIRVRVEAPGGSRP